MAEMAVTNDQRKPHLNMIEPKLAQTVYVPTSLYIEHGEDDFVGGKATISGIFRDDACSNEYNRLFVEVLERPGMRYNWRSLLEQQDKLREQFGDDFSKPDPDPAFKHLAPTPDPRFQL